MESLIQNKSNFFITKLGDWWDHDFCLVSDAAKWCRGQPRSASNHAKDSLCSGRRVNKRRLKLKEEGERDCERINESTFGMPRMHVADISDPWFSRPENPRKETGFSCSTSIREYFVSDSIIEVKKS